MSTPASLSSRLEAFIDGLGLRHFKGRELTPYWSRERKTKGGVVRNSPPPASLWPNIVPTLVVLDELREVLGVPVTLTSTYRSPAYNAAVGGERQSYHMAFMAIDLQAKGVSPTVVAERARGLRGKRFKNPLTGQRFVFAGGIGQYRTFTHIDTRGRNANW